jgi:hypothetical protein
MLLLLMKYGIMAKRMRIMVINATLVNKTLKVAGGAGIQGNVNIGGAINDVFT